MPTATNTTLLRKKSARPQLAGYMAVLLAPQHLSCPVGLTDAFPCIQVLWRLP